MTSRLIIEDFRPETGTLLGEGLWGRVYDLGDGSVLKVAQNTCAGIGNGREKVRREFEVLTRLANLEDLDGLIPRALAKGEVPHDSVFAAKGFAVWLRMEKIEGTRLSIPAIESAEPERQRRIGESIGGTLARLHRALEGPNRGGARLERSEGYADLKAAVAGSRFYLGAIAALEREWRRIPPEELRVCHNDYNISNLLFADDLVCGVLDFAEWGLGYPEKDISDIVSEIPDLKASVIDAYEEASGRKVDRRRLELGKAENALFGAVISAREGDGPGERSEQTLLVRHLETLGCVLTHD